MKAAYVYGWGSAGVAAEEFGAARNALGLDTVVIGANLTNGGMRAAVENCPDDLDIILQPSPLCATRLAWIAKVVKYGA